MGLEEGPFLFIRPGVGEPELRDGQILGGRREIPELSTLG